MEWLLMPGFSDNPDQKQKILAHMSAAAEQITAAKNKGADAEVVAALTHLHDAVVSMGKMNGVGFF
jgi:hypothetical protein